MLCLLEVLYLLEVLSLLEVLDLLKVLGLVGVVIRSVERYDQVKIKPTDSEAKHPFHL